MEGTALVLMVPFFGTVVVVTVARALVVTATAEVDAGAEVAGAPDEAGGAVLATVGGVIVTPFSAQSSTATWTAAVQYHGSARVD
jgi:hypothetical protein